MRREADFLRETTMSQPMVVAFLVRCTESLLICEDIPTEHLKFRDIPDCRRQLPVLIETAQARLFGQVVMGRCHYLLGKSVQDSHRIPPTASLSLAKALRVSCKKTRRQGLLPVLRWG